MFKVTPAGVLTTLYSFGSTPADGQLPAADLIQASDGNFYGTTESGGAYFYGTVFQITPAGTLTILHNFGSTPSDGQFPYAGLIEGTDGNLYGTTGGGGANNGGTVYRLQLPGSTPYTCTNTTPPTITFVDSASSYGGYPYFASGSWLEIKGSNLADLNDPRLNSAVNPGQWTASDFTRIHRHRRRRSGCAGYHAASVEPIPSPLHYTEIRPCPVCGKDRRHRSTLRCEDNRPSHHRRSRHRTIRCRRNRRLPSGKTRIAGGSDSGVEE